MFKVTSPVPVPDDVVRSVEVGEVELNFYRDDGLRGVKLRFLGGSVPLKIGERVEVEVVGIERTIVER